MFFTKLFLAVFTISLQTLSLSHPLGLEHHAQSLTSSSTTSRFMPSHKISPASLSAIISSRQQANATDAPVGTAPLGYTMDPCRNHSDCLGDRLCLAGNLQGSCNGGDVCLCIGESIQLCDRNCTECDNYPNETCGYLPRDLEEAVPPEGVCSSTYTVFEGLIVEIGCNTFPNITPFPSDGEEEPEEEEDEESMAVFSSPQPSPVSVQ